MVPCNFSFGLLTKDGTLSFEKYPNDFEKNVTLHQCWAVIEK